MITNAAYTMTNAAYHDDVRSVVDNALLERATFDGEGVGQQGAGGGLGA
jgi:hypothetical protein